MEMVETGYRYNELYWAGQDENWDYARYQIEKIALALDRGLERRPARSESAQQFINQAIPDMKTVIETEKPDQFSRQFSAFTQFCNACHAAENVTHFNVMVPENRQGSNRLE